MKRLRILIALAGILVFSCFIVGCGGGGTGPATNRIAGSYTGTYTATYDPSSDLTGTISGSLNITIQDNDNIIVTGTFAEALNTNNSNLLGKLSGSYFTAKGTISGFGTVVLHGNLQPVSEDTFTIIGSVDVVNQTSRAIGSWQARKQ